MKVKRGEKATVLIPKSEDMGSFIQKIQEDKTLQSENLILEMDSCNLKKKDLKLFVSLSQSHKQNKKSFVLVIGEMSYNEIPEELSVAPTLLEAFDIVELEEIERDLGF